MCIDLDRYVNHGSSMFIDSQLFLAFISLCFGEHRSVVSGGDIGRAANNLRSLAERYSHARFHVLLRRLAAEEAFHVLTANAVFDNVSSFDVGFVRVPVVAEVRTFEFVWRVGASRAFWRGFFSGQRWVDSRTRPRKRRVERERRSGTVVVGSVGARALEFCRWYSPHLRYLRSQVIRGR